MDQVPFRKGMREGIAFGTDNFAENPERRCPCVLLLDVSGSMVGEPMNQLNQGISRYRDALAVDDTACKRVEVAVVTFGGGVRTVFDFTTADQFAAPFLTCAGETPMGAAIEHAIDMIKRRKEVYKANGISFYRPWLFLLTDGEATDSLDYASQLVRQGEAAKAFTFFAVGVQGANMDALRQICPSREPLKLNGLRFSDLFLWLSASQAALSRSTPGTDVPLPNPRGWAVI